MPHVDVETLVSSCVGGGTDRKVNCETLAKNEDLPPDDDVDSSAAPDFPPESFWLSKDAEFDWFDRNAFLERKESGKGISNNSTYLNTNNQNSNSNSQKFSTNLKSSLFGLPNTKKTSYVDTKRRSNKPAHLFPKKRSESIGKSSVTVVEPSSPKVSCIGRVRSKRCRRKSGENKKNRVKSIEKSRTSCNESKKGFYSRIMSIFKVHNGCDGEIGTESTIVVEPSTKKSTSGLPEFVPPVVTEPPQAPMIGGMKKLASGRRSGSGTTDDFAGLGPI